jgi:hypothetical protein
MKIPAAIVELQNEFCEDEEKTEYLDAIFQTEDDGSFIASTKRAAFKLSFPGKSFSDDLTEEQKNKFEKKHGELSRFVKNCVRPIFVKHLKGGCNA